VGVEPVKVRANRFVTDLLAGALHIQVWGDANCMGVVHHLVLIIQTGEVAGMHINSEAG